MLPFGPVVDAPPLPPAPAGDVGVATTKLVSVSGPLPGILVVIRSKLDDALTTGVLPLEADADALVVVAGVVTAVLVVERLPVGVEVTGVVVTTVVDMVTGVVPDGVLEGVSVVVMVVGGKVVTGVVVIAVVVELSFLLYSAATATVGRNNRAAARILNG